MNAVLAAPFTSAPVADRLAALFDAGSDSLLPAESGLRLARATVAGRPVLAVATDPALDKGVLGSAECADLRRMVRRARQTQTPLVLLIDSAGARLDAGLAIQGALRALMTELLDASLAGLPMIALLGRNVFGGASMLAFAASQRCYAPDTVLAMSGPRVLESAGGGSLAAVRDAIGGLARCRHGGAERLLDDSLPAYAAALRDWVQELPTGPLPDTLDEERRMLGLRLGETAPPPTARFAGRPEQGTLRCGGRACVGAADALQFAALVEQTQTPLELWIDCAGHSLHLGDENLILSQYLVHLARSVRRRVHRGQAVRLRIAGEISGGIYIAVAGAASSVDIAPEGSVRTLPQTSLSSILTRPDAAISNACAAASDYVELGVADTVSAPV
ncbi:hypothetical protein N0K08_09920 [Acidovorax sp. Be4]|uniref:Acetyl-coenzyme A carboxylase carboxyl transferase subunit beta domain-containing protein n=1 Tax=Acidovorax bellezanensis TaxID=2976702 RepID=A0ABT2PP31_9BURK|nr:biotin-independent malonate decarboxylase subunit gamma [Acidovorax sp. Be4]MCT9810952.1 hypothetical protein [Acidovorax sp. Be4]